MINGVGASEINKVEELKNNRVQYENYLKNEYKKYYLNVRKYIFTSNILEIQKEEVMSDVIEMFIDYQEYNKDISSLLGGDHENFCREIIESLKTTRLGKVYTLINFIETFIGVMVVEFFIVLACSFFGIKGLQRIDSLDFMVLVAVAIFLGISIGKYRIRNIYTPWAINKLEFIKDLRFLGILVFIVILIEQTIIENLDFYVNNGRMVLMLLIGLILLFTINIIKVIFAKGMKS